MELKKGRLYFIKDEFLDTYGLKYKLMGNKLDKGTKRPTYFCFKDNEFEGLLWFVPMSRQYEKYQKIYINIKSKIHKEPNNFVFCENLQGIKSVFLIQNMFPTTKRYVQEEYLRKEQEIRIPIDVQKKILRKAKENIYLAKKGIVSTYTNLPEFLNEIKNELIIENELTDEFEM